VVLLLTTLEKIRQTQLIEQEIIPLRGNLQRISSLARMTVLLGMRTIPSLKGMTALVVLGSRREMRAMPGKIWITITIIQVDKVTKEMTVLMLDKENQVTLRIMNLGKLQMT